MSSFSTETQSIAGSETQSIASTQTQSIAGVEVQKIMPRQTLRGHTNWVTGAVHLPGGRRIITCSGDDSLRLWDLENGAQIGEDWRDEKDTGVWCMALSPDGKTLASGCVDGNVRLWDVESRRVIAIWLSPGDTNVIGALAWSINGKQVLSGSWDGMARVWDVESGVVVLVIQTGRTWVNTVTYSPNNTRIATGSGSAAKIWDVKTGYLLNTLKHNSTVGSLTWTLDGKKFISGSYGPIRIYDTFTWQVIAILEGHLGFINAISLSFNNRLLASTSDDKTVRLWNLDTNLPIGPPLQHKGSLRCAAISADGKLLVTGSVNTNAYIWDIHAILKEAGLEDLLPPSSDVKLMVL
ncbi:WD40 repeat-like protein [Suillus hirtellus]|nr:WD40 repeat-like protein [Suillus hirtellus]